MKYDFIETKHFDKLKAIFFKNFISQGALKFCKNLASLQERASNTSHTWYGNFLNVWALLLHDRNAMWWFCLLCTHYYIHTYSIGEGEKREKLLTLDHTRHQHNWRKVLLNPSMNITTSHSITTQHSYTDVRPTKWLREGDDLQSQAM